VLAALAVTGCNSGDDKRPKQAAPTATQTQTTRVEVVKGLGSDGGFQAQEIYDRLAPGVVTVIAITDTGGGGLFGRGAPQGGLGTGFVLDAQGRIATNAHVVTTGTVPKLERAKQVYVEFGDGNRLAARIVGVDPNSDIALLQVRPQDLRGPRSKLVPLELGSSIGLAVGEPVAAIGSPFGERQSLSLGVVSALDRDIESLTTFRIGNAIQTDAAINHGNSGGPLLDAHGRVIGVNSQIRSTGGGGEGVGFAIPVETVKRAVAELEESGEVRYAFVGISSQELYPQLAEKLGVDALTGALVGKVEPGSPADKAGIEPGKATISFQGQRDIPKGGDVIVGVDGKRLKGADDLADFIGLHRPGQTVKMEVVRGKKHRTVAVKLAARPQRAPARPGG
jgi:S1-C subfamily serine protease